MASKFELSTTNVRVAIVAQSKIINGFDSLGPKYLNLGELKRIISLIENGKEHGGFEISLKLADETLFSSKNENLNGRMKVKMAFSVLCSGIYH